MSLAEPLRVATQGATRQQKRVLLERTLHPGVYKRGGKFVAVYRLDGRQIKESAATFADARAIKLRRDVEAATQRRGPILHDYALRWADTYRGRGHDAIRGQTREEYRRLLITYALHYFGPAVRLGELDRRTLQGFIGWIVDQTGPKGRLSDRSIRNAVTPLRACLRSAATEGLVSPELLSALVLPSRRGGRRWEVSERRFLTREALGRLLGEIPAPYAPLFSVLASTGLRISEAIALRWRDLDLDANPPRLRVRRTIVNGVVGAPKSRHGARVVPLSFDLASRLRSSRALDFGPENLVFQGPAGGPLTPDRLRKGVLNPAARRAGVDGVGLHTLRHTCAALLIEQGASRLRLQRWMGHHSAAYTLDVYGHLIDGDLGLALTAEDIGLAPVKPASGPLQVPMRGLR